MKQPRILAFMQNPWFEPGTRPEIIDRYKTDQEFHRRLLARTMSGQRLLTAFGPTMFMEIWWDNVAPKAAVEAAGVTDIDMQHVDKLICDYKPDIILAFGKLAEKALDNSFYAELIPYFCCHHPNARGYTMLDLAAFAVQITDWINEWRLQQ